MSDLTAADTLLSAKIEHGLGGHLKIKSSAGMARQKNTYQSITEPLQRLNRKESPAFGRNSQLAPAQSDCNICSSLLRMVRVKSPRCFFSG